jgi:hypothetical protein
MKNIMCQPVKHTGLNAFALQQPVWATFGTSELSSIRRSEKNYDAGMPVGFIEGEGYT